MSDYKENNHVIICGKIISEQTFSHEVYSERFYVVKVQVMRLSDACDDINVLISERLFSPELELTAGSYVKVTGQFRSYNNYSGNGNKLVLTVFTKEIEPYNLDSGENPNQIYLDGYICKPTTYRVTPFGREMLRRFLYDICKCSGDWQMSSFAKESIAALREQMAGKKHCRRRSGMKYTGMQWGVSF